jgi:hypothetical protein
MSNETKQALDLFCEVYKINAEQREKIESLMKMAYLEGGIEVRQLWINTTSNYGNTIRHHSGAAQN